MTRPKETRLTADDILDSLTRRAEFRQRLGQENRVKLEEMVEIEDLSWCQGLSPEPPSGLETVKKRSLRHLPYVFTLLVGLTVVWLYTSILERSYLASLSWAIQKSGVQSIFANQAQFGIVALAAILGALWIRHRKHGRTLLLRSI